MAGEAGACSVGADSGGFVGCEKEFSHRCQMQRCASTNSTHDLHARTLRISPLYIDDFVALTHRQVHGLPGFAMQLAHGRHGRFPNRKPRLHQIAEFQQTHAEPVSAWIGTVNQTAGHHVVQDAVRGRRMQRRALREFFKTDGIGMRGKRIEQAHHALDHLNGRSGFRARIAHGENQLIRQTAEL